MEVKACPICDQKMSSAHYCKICHRYVRHPYIRRGDYYLNEPAPQRITYHRNESGEQPEQRIASNQPNQPYQPARDRGASAGDGQTAWKPVGRHPLRNQHPLRQSGMPPARAAGGQNPPASLIGVLVIGVICLIGCLGVAAYFRDESPTVTIQSIFPGRELDDELNLEEIVEDYEVLDEQDVIDAGIACNSCGHFHTTGKEMEARLVEMMETSGLAHEGVSEYSYNERYDDGTTWFTSTVIYYLETQLDDAYPVLAIDYDTATGALHEVDLTMEDPEMIVGYTEMILVYLMINDDFVEDLVAVETVRTGLREAFNSNEHFSYDIDGVQIYGDTYDDIYVVYISKEPQDETL